METGSQSTQAVVRLFVLRLLTELHLPFWRIQEICLEGLGLMKKTVVWTIASIVVGILSPQSHAQLAGAPPREVSAQPYLTPQHLVTIALGRRLNVYCSGSGSPTVILESGYGGDSTAWRYVQPLIAKHTHVCSYDRAGERFSDPGPYPRDLHAMTSDLHALAATLSLPKPFILVGHSMGGMNALMYADRYKSDLSGLVLIEPGTMYDHTRYSTLGNVWTQYLEGTTMGFVSLRGCYDLASNSAHRYTLLEKCSWRDASYTAELNQVQDEIIEKPSFWKSLLSVDLSLRSTGDSYLENTQKFFGSVQNLNAPIRDVRSLDEVELQQAQERLDSLPLVVVSVAERSDPSEPEAVTHTEWSMKNDMYEELTKLSTQSRLVTVSNSGHNVQFDQPEKTAEIILELVAQVRADH